MAQKVYSRSSKREKICQIDRIPDHQKQQRSPPSKRNRTDFFLFSSSSEERLRPLSDFYGASVAEAESSHQNGINCRNSEQGSEVAVSESENALKRKGDLDSPAESPQTPDGSVHLDQQDQSKDQSAPSNSSVAEDGLPKPRRGTRERRRNARFDKVVFQQNPPRNIRRFRIMRNLGLIAPVGSPF